MDTNTTMPGNEETFWELEIKSGTFYTTSLDGLTEALRFKVNKPITNKQIVEKLAKVPQIKSHINLKIYMISCYPNEGMPNLGELMQICKELERSKTNNKFMLKIYFTPFTPEPTTPMQFFPLQITYNLKNQLVKLLGPKLHIYQTPKVRMQINQAINSPFTLVKRAILNRGHSSDLELVRYLIFNPKMANHNLTHDEKLEILKANFDLAKFTRSYKVGSLLASSNIKSWETDLRMEAMAYKAHQAFKLVN